MIIGIILLAGATYYVAAITGIIFSNEVNGIYIEEIVIPVIPAMIGAYCVYSATRTGPILTLQTAAGKRYRFPVQHLEHDKSVDALTIFLKEKLGLRIVIIRTNH